MANIVTAYRGMAYIVMAYRGMAYIVMAYVVMPYSCVPHHAATNRTDTVMVMAYIAMALHSYGLILLWPDMVMARYDYGPI